MSWLVDRDGERSVLASALHGLAVDADPSDYAEPLVRDALRVMSAYGLPVGRPYEHEHLVALAVRLCPGETDAELRGASLCLVDLERVVFRSPVVAGKSLVRLTSWLRDLARLRRVLSSVAAVEAGLRVAVEQGAPVDVRAAREGFLAAVAPLLPTTEALAEFVLDTNASHVAAEESAA